MSQFKAVYDAKKYADKFCEYGGPYLGPLLMPLFPGLLIIPGIIALIMYIVDVVNKNKKGSNNTATTASKDPLPMNIGILFLVYYILIFVIACIYLQIKCRQLKNFSFN